MNNEMLASGHFLTRGTVRVKMVRMGFRFVVATAIGVDDAAVLGTAGPVAGVVFGTG
jgi:hypothetical protein